MRSIYRLCNVPYSKYTLNISQYKYSIHILTFAVLLGSFRIKINVHYQPNLSTCIPTRSTYLTNGCYEVGSYFAALYVQYLGRGA